METEKAIKELKALKSSKGYNVLIRDYEVEIIETILKELEKKDKIIDLMVNMMIENDECKHFIENHCINYAGENKKTCDVCIKQYFEKKAEESE